MDAGVPGPADFARACVAAHVAGVRPPAAPDDAFYGRRAACFVTLKRRGGLRGCIGTLEPAEPSLGDEIVRNARSSALQDPRFPPVAPDEVDGLSVSVDVLSASAPCDLDELDPALYGVIVEAGFRRGVLLPALDGIDTVSAQVGIALQKAGIRPDEPFAVRRFTVARYSEGDPALDEGSGTARAPADD